MIAWWIKVAAETFLMTGVEYAAAETIQHAFIRHRQKHGTSEVQDGEEYIMIDDMGTEDKHSNETWDYCIELEAKIEDLETRLAELEEAVWIEDTDEDDCEGLEEDPE